MRRQNVQTTSRTTVFGWSQLSLRRDLGEELANMASPSGSSQILDCDSARLASKTGNSGYSCNSCHLRLPPCHQGFRNQIDPVTAFRALFLGCNMGPRFQFIQRMSRLQTERKLGKQGDFQPVGSGLKIDRDEATYLSDSVAGYCPAFEKLSDEFARE